MIVKPHIALLALITSVSVVAISIPGSDLGSNTPISGEWDSIREPDAPDSVVQSLTYTADVAQGAIGSAEAGTADDARDNVFHVQVNRSPTGYDRVWLEYELEGLADQNSVARSVNHAPVMGGLVVRKAAGWSKQRERIPTEQVHKGRNTVFFTAWDPRTCYYHVRNVRLVVEPGAEENEHGLVLTSAADVRYGDAIHIKGFVTGRQWERTHVLVDGRLVELTDGAFETIVKGGEAKAGRALIVEAIFPDGTRARRECRYRRSVAVNRVVDAEPVGRTTIHQVEPERRSELVTTGVRLSTDSGSTASAIGISVAPLRSVDVAPLPGDLVNVTGHGRGFRFLPDGIWFDKPVRLSLAYDPALIPAGYTPADVRTYFFDETQRNWKVLPLDTLMIRDSAVVSFTTHFTDYINGIIQVPESPETMGYTPTSIKDFKAGDVSAGITPLSPPVASNTGAATTRFPIKLPAGRQGMQPELAIQYNSEGGNGWMGLGWDLRTPSITIDTRWGVPRYDTNLETETYLLDGEMLSPVAHRGWVAREEPLRVFHPRVEGAFRKIERRGSSPSSYWWIVTDKEGTKSYYGGVAAMDPDAVLRDAQGHIAKWQLVKVMDSNSNTIIYEYDTVQDPGTAGSPNMGSQIYPKRIRYTGLNDVPGKYSVEFFLDDGDRPDKQVNARSGFKEVTAHRLERIDVRFQDQLIRRYRLSYQIRAFKKSLLQRVREYDKNDDFFYEQEFTYHDDIRTGEAYLPYEQAPSDWSPDSLAVVPGPLLNPTGLLKNEPTSIGGTESSNFGFGGAITIGPAVGSLWSKVNTIGGNYYRSRGSGENTFSLMDVDGDNLPDRLFRFVDGQNQAEIRYQSNLFGSTGTTGFGAIQPIPSLADASFGRTRTKSTTKGFEAHPLVAYIGVSWSGSETTTRNYLLDRNGDGLMDVAQNGVVKFNRIVGGLPTFDNSSAETENPVSGGPVSENIQQFDPGQIDVLTEENPLHDVVSVWIAPYQGHVNITGAIELINNASTEALEYGLQDGVRVAVQVNDDELEELDISWNSAGTQYPFPEAGALSNVPVQKDDRIYFRLRSRFDGAYDQVLWDRNVVYIDTENPSFNSSIGPNGEDPLAFNAAGDHLLSGSNVILVPGPGVFSVTGEYNSPALTDDVELRVSVYDANTGITQIAYSQILAANSPHSLPVSTVPFNVDTGISIELSVRALTNVAWQAIDWEPVLSYVSDQDDTTEFKPMVEYTMYNYVHKRLNEQFNYWTSYPTRPILALDTVLVTISEPSFTFATEPCVQCVGQRADITLSVKSEGQLVARQRAVFENGLVNILDPEMTFTAYEDTVYYVECHVDNRVLWDSIFTAIVIDANVSQIGPDNTWDDAADEIKDALGVHTQPVAKDLIFGQQFRSWGRFIYRGNDTANAWIDTTLLSLEEGVSGGDADLSDDFNDPDQLEGGDVVPSTYDPAHAEFVYMAANRARGVYVGFDEFTFMGRDTVSSSRMGEDDLTFAVPGQQNDSLVYVPNKRSKSANEGVSTSVGYSVFNAGFGSSNGSERTIVEVMDMNGDRHPDNISGSHIQMTKPDGALEEVDIPHPFSDTHLSRSEASGFTTAGSFPTSKSSNSGGTQSSGDKMKAALGLTKLDKNSQSSSESAKASLSVSFSGNWSRDTTINTWLDINGDGLPDRVREDGKVALNIGYDFLPYEAWGFPAVRDGSGSDFSVGTGISVDNASMQFGLGGSWTTNKTSRGFQDVNGDGLVDFVYRSGHDPDVDRVRLNTGTGFAPGVAWSTPGGFDEGYSAGESVNAGFTVCIPIFWVAKLCFNPSLNAGMGISRTETQWTDLNGDGFADYLKSDGANELRAWHSTIGRTNLLKEVRGPFNSRFTIDYEVAGNSYDLPQSKWVMKELLVYDGHVGDGPDSMRTTFEYSDGRYDRRERETYGFGTVRTKEWDTAPGGSTAVPYRTMEQTYDVSSYYTKGLPLVRSVSAGTSLRYTQTLNSYRLLDLDGDQVASWFAQDSDDSLAFPALVRTEDRYYEGMTEPGMRRVVGYDYDDIGNVVLYVDSGNPGQDDVVRAHIDYVNYPGPNIVGIPASVEVTVDNVTRRKRQQSVDETTGNITQIRQHIGVDTIAVYDLEYDTLNGNLTRIIRPANDSDQRMFYAYEYDTTVATYVTKVSDAYGYSSESVYDYHFGQLTRSTDINDQVTTYGIDDKGRVDTVRGPYEVDSLPYTILIEYHPEASTPYSLVKHYDPEHPGTDIETCTFLDGLFRPIQVKKSAVVSDGTGTPEDRAIVSGRIEFDAFGRTIKQLYPTLNLLPGIQQFESAADTVSPTITHYDVLDREDSVALPDGTHTVMDYQFGEWADGDSAFVTRTTDHLQNFKDSYTDIRGRQVARTDFDPSPIWTRFHYNGVGELLDVTDQGDNHTTYSYDLLGRKLSYQHPDGGLTKFTYDPAGNLTSKNTGNLLTWWPDGNGPIKYAYDFERPVRIDYPRNYQNQVSYTYGETGATFNRAGRVVLQQDATGGQEFFYGPLGEVEKTIRTIIVSQGDIRTYVCEQKYDTWNRVQEMAYPDGEVVKYNYNRAGLLESMGSEKAGFQYPIIDKIGYDKFEQRVYLKQGNGVVTNYTYEDIRRRLSTLKVKPPNDPLIMDNAYIYDPVNNITALVNSREVPSNAQGGSMVAHYAYDRLYRLDSASGVYTGDGRTDNYDLHMEYDNLHNITAKAQHHTSSFPFAVLSNYTNAYTYGGSKPHAPERIGDRNYSYDANGNLEGWEQDAVPTPASREIAWDEENRMQSLSDGGYISQFTYDAGGERVLKSHGGMQSAFINGAPVGFINHRENFSIYVSPYLVHNPQGFTKHYYIEGQRVASRMGTGQFNGYLLPNGLTAGGLNYASRINLLNQAANQLYGNQGLPPGPPTLPNYYGQPEQGGDPIYVGPIANTEIPAPGTGWPQPPLPGGNQTGPPGEPTVTLPTVTRDDVHAGYGFQNETNQAEPNRYFYHPDHLGSSSYITDGFGHVRQHVEYMAFGETFVEEHGSDDVQPYLFNGKELDRVTGLYYYGARYYDPVASMWASVDPMAEKSPGFSPMNFTNLNPLRFVDPNGNEEFTTEELQAIATNAHDESSPLPKGIIESPLNRLLNTNDWSGARSKLYERTTDGKTHYAYGFSGTEGGDPKDWFLGNAAQLLGISPQYQVAMENATTLAAMGISGSRIQTTGWSKGGGEAMAAAIVLGSQAVTFNAAGLSNSTRGKAVAIGQMMGSGSASFDNYIRHGDVVHLGNFLGGLKPLGNQHLILPKKGPLIQGGAFTDRHDVRTIFR